MCRCYDEKKGKEKKEGEKWSLLRSLGDSGGTSVPRLCGPSHSTLRVLTPVGRATLADSTVQQAVKEEEEEGETRGAGATIDRPVSLCLAPGKEGSPPPPPPLCVSRSTEFENVFVHTQGKGEGGRSVEECWRWSFGIHA